MPHSKNHEQKEMWDGSLGEGFLKSQEYIDRIVTPFSDAAIKKTNPNSNDKILDVGCGAGSTSIQLAISGAEVKGVDISDKMISRARKKSEGIPNISFQTVDASQASFDERFTKIFSRFGVMFFSDPVEAFTNLHKSLDQKGKITFLCWQAITKNEWIYVSAEALQAFQPKDIEPPDPKAPGGFAFADGDYIKEILESANYSDIAIEALETKFDLGKSLEEIMSFNMNVGPLAGLVDTMEEEIVQEATESVKRTLDMKMGKDGLHLSAAAWLVTASA